MDYLHTHTHRFVVHTTHIHVYWYVHTYIHISYILSVTAVHLQDDMAEGTINEENKL